MPAFVSIRNGPFRGVSRQRVRRWAERMLRCLDLSRAELSVAITNDREIRELNKVFRHRDRATDVLAFAMREGEPRRTSRAAPAAALTEEMLGDVVVSAETARRQAKQRRASLDAEIRMLLAHGLLHLIGHDHRSDHEEVIMTTETQRLCRAAHRDAAASEARLARARSKAGAPAAKAGARRATESVARVRKRRSPAR